MQTVKVELDQEWVNLILEAKSLGIKQEEIREFLHVKGLHKK